MDTNDNQERIQPRALSPSDSGKRGAERSVAARRIVEAERQKRVLLLHGAGMSNHEIARRLGVSERTIRRDLIDQAPALRDATAVLESAQLDSEDCLRILTEMADADLADLYHDPAEDRCAGCECQAQAELRGTLLPVKRWPAVWRRGLAAEVKVEPNMVRSKDGGGESWDRAGDKVTVKVVDRLRVLELAMRHQAVDALAKPKETAEIDHNIRITWGPAPAGAPELPAAESARVIDVTPAESEG